MRQRCYGNIALWVGEVPGCPTPRMSPSRIHVSDQPEAQSSGCGNIAGYDEAGLIDGSKVSVCGAQ